ncbi:MAG TPA: PilZ domain-containing protein [Azospirillum sp.]
MIRRFLGLNSDRRHDRRFDARGGALVCNEHRFPLVELSLSGMRVEHHPAMFRPGQRVSFVLELPMAVRRLTVHGEAVVARVHGGTVGMRFERLDIRLLRLIAFFIGTRTPYGAHQH